MKITQSGAIAEYYSGAIAEYYSGKTQNRGHVPLSLSHLFSTSIIIATLFKMKDA